MKKCPFCGQHAVDTDTVCPACGGPLAVPEEQELLGSMGGKPFSVAPGEQETLQGTGLLGQMGKRRYETEEKPVPPSDVSPELRPDAGFAGRMGKVRYGTRPADSGEKKPQPPEKKPDRNLLIAISVAAIAVAASLLLVFRESVFGTAEVYGMGLGGFINYYAPVGEEDIREEEGVRYVGDQLVIVSSTEADFEEMKVFFDERDMSVLGYVELIDSYQVQLSEEHSLAELHRLAAELEEDEHVDSATINAIRDLESFALPNDPWGGNAQWDAPRAGRSNWGVMAIGAPACWERYEPSEVRVGVIDSMFDENQEDLHFAVTRDNEVFSFFPARDDSGARGHGTHVSGTIGAIHNNGVGIAGVAENCQLYGYCSYTYSGTIDTVSAIAELAAQDVRVINYSMGYVDEVLSQAMDTDGMERDVYYRSASAFSETALQRLLDKGYDFVLVCAAGNMPLDARWTSVFTFIEAPQIRDRILAVGAAGLNHRGNYYAAEFSAVGSRVDVMAPGVDICSTVPDGGYAYWSGTSMAAPHVSGVCASVWAQAPQLSGAELVRLIKQTANTPVLGSQVGMVNMEAAMAAVS